MIDFQYPQKYRGKSVDSGKWFFGSYIEQEMHLDYYRYFIVPRDSNSLMRLDNETWIQRIIEIHEMTLGKYSGKEDVEGNPIYSGDILCRKTYVTDEIYSQELFAVYFAKDCFYGEGDSFLSEDEFNTCEIVGNIFDNYELFFQIEEAIELRKEAQQSNTSDE